MSTPKSAVAARLAPLLTLCAGLLGASALPGCSGEQRVVGECVADGECPVGSFCKRGICACRSDEACGAGEVCNSQNVCQKRSGCRSNGECPNPAETFCDLATGNCIDKILVDQRGGVAAGCGTDVHCDPGSVCDPSRRSCVSGCLEDADCPLYRVCDRNGVPAGELGRCVGGVCSDRSFCDFGEICDNGTCRRDPNPNHCKTCNPGEAMTCGDDANFCLIDPFYDESNPQSAPNFCGVACDPANDTCPNGYQCGLVRLLTGLTCRKNSDCCDPSINPNAQGAQECCADGAGECPANRYVCGIGEGEVRGGCSCLRDEDCRTESLPALCAGSCGGLGVRLCLQDSDCAALPCDLTPRGRRCQSPQGRMCATDDDCMDQPICADLGTGQTVCVFDGRPCTSATDCLCSMNRCINSGRACSTGADCQLSCQGGGCIIGASCAPSEGISCEQLRTGN